MNSLEIYDYNLTNRANHISKLHTLAIKGTWEELFDMFKQEYPKNILSTLLQLSIEYDNCKIVKPLMCVCTDKDVEIARKNLEYNRLSPHKLKNYKKYKSFHIFSVELLSRKKSNSPLRRSFSKSKIFDMNVLKIIYDYI